MQTQVNASTEVVAYVVVHTVGGAFNDVERFDADAYATALDCAAEIREHDGHYARLDAVYADGRRGIL